MATPSNAQKLGDLWWILCANDGRDYLKTLLGVPQQFTKGDGAYQNGLIGDIIRAVGRIETVLARLEARPAAAPAAATDPAIIAAAVVDAIGVDLAKEVVAELGKKLTEEG